MDGFRASWRPTDTRDLRARHNRALALRQQGDSASALAEIEAVIRAGLALPQTLTARAHLLADLGRSDEAVAQYRAVIAAQPDFIDAQRGLALLLPQIGRRNEALAEFRAALARCPESAPLWLAALITATELEAFEELGAWGAEGAERLGDYPEFGIARATAHARLGDPRRAVAILQQILARTPEPQPVHVHLAHALVTAGDPQAAEHHALAAARMAPEDQTVLALLTVIWRLLEDGREAWLADYDRLVVPIDLALSGIEIAALVARLELLHVASEHPAEQSLRGGSQTRGNLFDRREPELVALAATIREALRAALAALPEQPDHPFLGRRTGDLRFGGSWSVRLRSEGRHVPHIHQTGWLSSALYLALPPEVTTVENGGAGALAFGVPDERLGLSLPPRRVETPRVGRLVVFPSYFWHGTLPFRSAAPRMTVAFDALPA